MRNVLEDAGVATQTYAKDPARPNLIARVRGAGDAPPLLLQGHVDVVTTVQTLAEQSPRGRDLPLIVEVGWLPNSVAEDRVEAIQEAVKESLAYLRQTVPAYLSA